MLLLYNKHLFSIAINTSTMLEILQSHPIYFYFAAKTPLENAISVLQKYMAESDKSLTSSLYSNLSNAIISVAYHP